MRGDRTFRAHAQRTDYNHVVEILLTCEGEGRTAFAQPVQFVDEPEDAAGSYHEPTLRLRTDEGQKLMDALWEAGLRPSEGAGSAGALAATQRHLDDMRRIVFDKLLPGGA